MEFSLILKAVLKGFNAFVPGCPRSRHCAHSCISAIIGGSTFCMLNPEAQNAIFVARFKYSVANLKTLKRMGLVTTVIISHLSNNQKFAWFIYRFANSTVPISPPHPACGEALRAFTQEKIMRILKALAALFISAYSGQ